MDIKDACNDVAELIELLAEHQVPFIPEKYTDPAKIETAQNNLRILQTVVALLRFWQSLVESSDPELSNFAKTYVDFDFIQIVTWPKSDKNTTIH